MSNWHGEIIEYIHDRQLKSRLILFQSKHLLASRLASSICFFFGPSHLELTLPLLSSAPTLDKEMPCDVNRMVPYLP